MFDQHTNIDIMTPSETHIIDRDYNNNEALFTMPGYTFMKQKKAVA